MAETSVAPSGTPSAVSAPPAAAPTAPSSSTSPTEIIAKTRAANSPAELRALVDNLRQNPLKSAVVQKKEPAPAPPAVEATPAEAPQEAVAPEAEVQPQEATPEAETQPDAGQETTPEETEPEETEDGGDGPITPISGKRAHLRLPETDQVGRLAAALMKRNRDMPMAEAVAKASAQLGIQPEVAQTKPAEETPQTPKLPRTVQEVEALTQQKFADLKKAMSEVRLEDAADIQAELMQLTQHRSNLERSAERESAQAAVKYDTDFSASEAKAVDLYPFAADPKSPGGKRMMEIERALEQNGDPLFNSPQKPLRIAQMVAAELNIAPRSKTPPAKPVAAPVAPAPKKGIVTTGSARTTPPVANQPPALDSLVKGAKTVHDLRAILRPMGIRSI